MELVALNDHLNKFQSAQQEMSQAQKELGNEGFPRRSWMEGQMTKTRGDIAEIERLITQMTEMRGDIAEIMGLLTSIMLIQGPEIGETIFERVFHIHITIFIIYR